MIFYRMEVYNFDWILSVYDSEAELSYAFINDAETLKYFFQMFGAKVWCGYGCERLDRWYLTAAINGIDPSLVKRAILKGEKPEELPELKNRAYIFKSYDCKTDLNAKKDLSWHIACLGGAIPPTTKNTGKLTEKEIEEAAKQLKYEVSCIKEIFRENGSGLHTTEFFVENFGLNANACYGKAKSVLVSKVLKAKRTSEAEGSYEISLPAAAEIRRYSRIPKWFAQAPQREDKTSQMPSQEIMGTVVRFSWGGIHAAVPCFKSEGLIVSYDVTAFYPSIQTKWEIGKEVIGDWERFKRIHEANLSLKRSGDKAARAPYKIADNCVSGLLKSPFSPLYAPKAHERISVTGQMLMLSLLEKLEETTSSRLIQANTDGIMLLVEPGELATVRETVNEWERATGMQTDELITDGRILQKDVNNYIIFDKQGNIVKVKGTLADPSPIKSELAVIRRDVREYFRNGTPPDETVKSCKRLIDFQRIISAPKGGAIVFGGKKLEDKVVRVFACKGEGNAVRISREDECVAAPFTSPNSFIINEDISQTSLPEELDTEWYVTEALKEISKWNGESSESKDTLFDRSGDLKTSFNGPDPLYLMRLPLKKKPLDEYDEEEIAAAALRFFQTKGVDVTRIRWSSVRDDIWKARLFSPEDKPGKTSIALTVRTSKPAGARLHSFRKGTDMFWSLADDPYLKEGSNPADSCEAENSFNHKKDYARAFYKESEYEAEAIEQAKKLYIGAEPLENISPSDTRGGPEYLKRKGEFEYAVTNDKSLRVTQGAKGELLVPFEDKSGIVTLQRITPDRKVYARGCPSPGKKGASHRIPGTMRGVIAICEGLATGLSVHRRYEGRIETWVCGSCGDMAKTGAQILKSDNSVLLIVAADNDIESKDGVNHGMLAAEKIKAISPERVLIDFVPDRRMDFNDAYRLGIEVPIPPQIRQLFDGTKSDPHA